MLNLADIKSVKLATKPIRVEAWGGDVLIQKLSVTKRDELAKHFGSDDPEKMKEAAKRTIIAGVIEESGQPIFSNEHMEMLGDQDGEAIQKLFGDILEFNGMTKKSSAELEKP
ncbi:MAG: hypothetical protein V7785_22015 [Bermanella sp.]